MPVKNAAGYTKTHTRVAELLLLLKQNPAGITQAALLQAAPSFKAQLDTRTQKDLGRIFSRDLKTLRETGYQIAAYAAPARHIYAPGHIYVLQEENQTLTLEPAEELLLQTALQLWGNSQRGNEIFGLRCKLAALTGGISSDYGVLRSVKTAELLSAAVLLAAIHHQKQVRLIYTKPLCRSEIRTVTPLRLHLVQNRWHLVALDSAQNSLRTFLLQRILPGVTMLNIQAAAVAAAEVTQKIQELDFIVIAKTAQVRVLKAGNKAVTKIRSSYEVTESKDVLTFQYGDSTVLAQQLVAGHPAVKAVAPTELVTETTKLLAQISVQHCKEIKKAPQLGAKISPQVSRLSNGNRVLLLAALSRLLKQREFLVSELAEFLGLHPHAITETLQQLDDLFALFDSADSGSAIKFVTDSSGIWVRLTGTAALPLPALNSDDIALLEQSLTALTPQLPQELQAAAKTLQTKIAQLLPSALSHNHPVTLGSFQAAMSPNTPKIMAALTGYQALKFEYAKNSRLVVPLELLDTEENWVLQGFCLARKKLRRFQVAKIENLQTVALDYALGQVGLSEKHYYELLDLEKQAQHAEPKITAVLAVKNTAKTRLSAFDLCYYTAMSAANFAAQVAAVMPLETVNSFAPTYDEWGYATAELWQADNVLRLVQAAPGEVIVLDPPQLRKVVANWAALSEGS